MRSITEAVGDPACRSNAWGEGLNSKRALVEKSLLPSEAQASIQAYPECSMAQVISIQLTIGLQAAAP